MAKSIQFTRQDTLHAAIGVIPAFLLICFGYLTPGIAFAIGLLPTSLLGSHQVESSNRSHEVTLQSQSSGSQTCLQHTLNAKRIAQEM